MSNARDNRAGMQVTLWYPVLRCSCCRFESFSYPWKFKPSEPIPVLFHPNDEPYSPHFAYEIAGAATEWELIGPARTSGWDVVCHGNEIFSAICPACRQRIADFARIWNENDDE